MPLGCAFSRTLVIKEEGPGLDIEIKAFEYEDGVV